MRRLLILLAATPLALAQGVSAGGMTQDPPAAVQQAPPQQTPPTVGKETKAASPAQTSPAASAAPAAAQEGPPTVGQETKPSSPAQAASAQQATPAAAPETSPVPAGEITTAGWIELGYRWRSDVGGNFDAYRSLVNLGSGPKLLGTEFSITDPAHRLFDDVHVRAYDWGDDPYATLHLDARKAKLYDFAADYRDIAYFDFLPSYADPSLANGIILNQQSFDTRRRFAHFELNMLPGNWISPYAAYDTDTGSGTGVTTYVANNNRYPIPTTLRDRTDNFRGGVHFELRRFHATLEQGGTWYHDDQTVYQQSGVNYGNSTTPVFGQTLYLTDLLGAYGAHGTSIYSKVLVTGRPVSWLDLYGQFLYSEPNSTVNYQEYTGGNLYLQSQILFYNAQQYLISSGAQMPHTTGNVSAEIRPWRRVRITEAWITDRLHNAGSSAQAQNILAPPSASQTLITLLQTSLANNYNQTETMLYFEATPQLTLRGGYRYVWGDGEDVMLPPAGLASSDHVRMRRNVGIGGLSYRPLKKVSLSAEGESGSSGGEYFRTSLWDYQKVRAQARYQATNTLSVSADFAFLANQNPQAGINLDYVVHQEALSIFWSPTSGKSFDFQGSYSRADLRSNIDYLDPGTLQPQVSAYRDNSHTGTALFHIHLPHVDRVAPELTAGGSFILSSGSRPTSYFQPMVKLALPIRNHVSWFGEWRYYGYGEAFYVYEGFRANLAIVGLRYTR